MVPGPAIGVELWITLCRQGLVCSLAIVQRRRPIHRRAQQWMAKPYACSDLHQVRVLRRRKSARFDPEPLRCTPEKCRVSHGVGRREQHELLRRLRQCGDSPQIVLTYSSIEISSGRKFKATCELRCGQAARQFQQSKRIATALRDDLVADSCIYRAVQIT